MDSKSLSKLLSLILRHQPEVIGATLDSAGWIDVDDLLEKLKLHGKAISRELLENVVATSDKQRFAFSEDGARIRANQGHSLSSVDLALEPTIPPDRLFHGTIANSIASIRERGLEKRSRQHVHLSKDEETARIVGSRRGKPVILVVRSREMHARGYAFYLSANHVWLTDHVPAEFIQFPED